MKTVLSNGTVVTGTGPTFTGSVVLEDGVIREIRNEAVLSYEDAEIIDCTGQIIMPGLIDIHSHGGFGIDYNDGSERIGEISRRLAREGTTCFMASFTVEPKERSLNLLADYSRVSIPADGASFLGCHMEGPFLSPAYHALMNEDWLRDASVEELNAMIEAGDGVLKMMTISPSVPGALDVIRAGTTAGISMMIGHTDCTCAQAKEALAAGAKGFTHLYNAMSQHTHREPGCVTAALSSDTGYCEMISDGFHVDPDVVRATYKAVGPERLIIITDSQLGRGMPDGDYVFAGLVCQKKGIEIRVKDSGRIAGSALSMIQGVRHLREWCGCSLEELVQMACVIPARIVHAESKGTLEAGKDGDVLVLAPDLSLVRVFVRGNEVHPKEI